MLKFWITILLTLNFSSMVMASDKAQTLQIVVPNFPPFFDKNASNGGVFVEMIARVFKEIKTHKPKFVYVPHKRVLREFVGGLHPAAGNIFDPDTVKKHGKFLSEPFFFYRDCFYSLKENNINISKIEDLKDNSLITYSGFKVFHGKDFASRIDKVRESSSFTYSEIHDPPRVTQMLVRKRAKVAFCDLLLFTHTLVNFTKVSDPKSVVDFHCGSVSINASFMAFKDKNLRDQFNKIFKELEKKKEISKILHEFKKKYKIEDI